MELTNEVRERLRQVVNKTGLSQKKFAEKINYSPNKISEILTGSNKALSRQFIQLLEDHFGVNPKWLETGFGSPCILSIQANTIEEQLLLKNFRLLDQTSRNILNEICALLYRERDNPDDENPGVSSSPQPVPRTPWTLPGVKIKKRNKNSP